ncbi:hypothetical protein MHH60_14260 [Paenibacillus sp. FSL H7-0716]|uniref:Peptidase S9 prolyl oligopeptidase catalytic domain-containing protein n=1 Tax=Paenibacillus odorifer TaxID=189426 RepID=A0AB36JL24_9BACL|nr:hypothetical protein [Paenibacillus odorifer]OME23528.1 hypothetical protein BSK47_03470 [Paenibacillus odorifer]
MKRKIAKRKISRRLSKPLVHPRVAPKRVFRQAFDRENILGLLELCKTNWLGFTEASNNNIYFIKVDQVTSTSIIGLRVWEEPGWRKGRKEYVTVPFTEIGGLVGCRDGTLPYPGGGVIVCISGRGGGVTGPNGMTKLRDTLRSKLTSTHKGINPNNIFHISWNKNNDSNPLGTPLISDILKAIKLRTRNITPSYLAIIGHSYGGWAASMLSRVTSPPNFVALIDPVYGSTNTMTSSDTPRGKIIKNWYQKFGITAGEPCTGIGRIKCSPARDGVACGYQNVPGAQNINEVFLKTWNGTVRTVPCLGKNPVSLHASHIDIDDDEWIHRQIFDQINKDLSKQIEMSKKKARRK